VSTHVESLDAAHPFIGVSSRRLRDGRVAVNLSADDVVSLEGTPAQVRSLLERALAEVDKLAPLPESPSEDENRHRLLRVVTREYDSTGCPACAVSSQALKPATPDLVLEHVCRDGRRVRFDPRTGARIVLS
jgi:hypothetical protein